MFRDLTKYKRTGHFFLKATDALQEVCNAPVDMDGVYAVYSLKDGKIDLVYIGSSGIRVSKTLKSGLSGLRESIINGPPSEKTIRSRTWPVKMLAENIDALDIYWWVTYTGRLKDNPKTVQWRVLRLHEEILGCLPKWNTKDV